MIWAIVVAVVVVVGAGAGIAVRRRRSESGMRSFRRHLDALSPEARREVADRVRKSLDDGPDGRER
ncbi:MAG: hypothetical protein ACKO27_11680 [Ilumatobacteraceae bacterium]